MARTRMIKPEFWRDQKLAKVSRDARLTYVGLWNIADDYGVLSGTKRSVLCEVFPFDDFDIKWIDELIEIGRIMPFEDSGENYFYIPKFLEHQKIDHPSKRIYPAPPDNILTQKIDTRESLASTSENFASANVKRPFELETELETEFIKNSPNSPKPANCSVEQKVENKQTSELLPGDWEIMSSAITRILQPSPMTSSPKILGKLLKTYRPGAIMYALCRLSRRINDTNQSPIKDRAAFLVNILKERPITASMSEGGDDLTFKEERLVVDWDKILFPSKYKTEVKTIIKHSGELERV